MVLMGVSAAAVAATLLDDALDPRADALDRAVEWADVQPAEAGLEEYSD